MKLQALASQLGATLDPPTADAEIASVCAIDSAEPGQVAFIADSKYAPLAATTRASALIVNDKFPAAPKPLLRVKNTQYAYARAVELLHPRLHEGHGIHPTAVIDSTARIAANASIGAYAVIGAGVEIGEHCTLLPHVVIYRGARIGANFFAHAHAVVREDCRIGDNVILQNGVVVGADGFGFAKDGARWTKIVQSGPAVIEDDVEIQANATVDRASVGQTRVARGAKIDNLVQVGHGSTVGENSMLCSQVGLAGSTVVGKDVILAGQVGVAGHCTIGDGAIATAQSGIPNDVDPGVTVSGYPAIENRQWLRSVAVFNKLPEIAKAIRAKAKQADD